jgi:hypothetical protein
LRKCASTYFRCRLVIKRGSYPLPPEAPTRRRLTRVLDTFLPVNKLRPDTPQSESGETRRIKIAEYLNDDIELFGKPTHICPPGHCDSIDATLDAFEKHVVAAIFPHACPLIACHRWVGIDKMVGWHGLPSELNGMLFEIFPVWLSCIKEKRDPRREDFGNLEDLAAQDESLGSAGFRSLDAKQLESAAHVLFDADDENEQRVNAADFRDEHGGVDWTQFNAMCRTKAGRFVSGAGNNLFIFMQIRLQPFVNMMGRGLRLSGAGTMDTKFKHALEGTTSTRVVDVIQGGLVTPFFADVKSLVHDEERWDIIQDSNRTERNATLSFCGLSRGRAYVAMKVHRVHLAYPGKLIGYAYNMDVGAGVVMSDPSCLWCVLTHKHMAKYPTEEELKSDDSVLDLQVAAETCNPDIGPIECRNAQIKRLTTMRDAGLAKTKSLKTCGADFMLLRQRRHDSEGVVSRPKPEITTKPCGRKPLAKTVEKRTAKAARQAIAKIRPKCKRTAQRLKHKRVRKGCGGPHRAFLAEFAARRGLNAVGIGAELSAEYQRIKVGNPREFARLQQVGSSMTTRANLDGNHGTLLARRRKRKRDQRQQSIVDLAESSLGNLNGELRIAASTMKVKFRRRRILIQQHKDLNDLQQRAIKMSGDLAREFLSRTSVNGISILPLATSSDLECIPCGKFVSVQWKPQVVDMAEKCAASMDEKTLQWFEDQMDEYHASVYKHIDAPSITPIQDQIQAERKRRRLPGSSDDPKPKVVVLEGAEDAYALCRLAGRCLHVGRGRTLSLFHKALAAPLKKLFPPRSRPRSLLDASTVVVQLYPGSAVSSSSVYYNIALVDLSTWHMSLLHLLPDLDPIRQVEARPGIALQPVGSWDYSWYFFEELDLTMEWSCCVHIFLTRPKRIATFTPSRLAARPYFPPFRFWKGELLALKDGDVEEDVGLNEVA